MLGEGGSDGVGELFGGSFAAEVAGNVLAFAVDLPKGVVDADGGGAFADVVEHEDGAHEESGGIGDAFSGDVGGGAVNGFEDGAFVADVSAGYDAEAADQAGGEIAHHVAVEIGQEQDVELPRVYNDLHAGVVDDQFLILNIGEF